MYIAKIQGQTTPGDKILMLTETSRHFGHLFRLIAYIFFIISIHVVSPGAGADNLLGTEVFMSTGISWSLWSFVASFKNISLSQILYNVFHDFKHVYIPRARADSPRG